MTMPISPMVTRVVTSELTESALPGARVVHHYRRHHPVRLALARGLRGIAAVISPESGV